MSNSEETVKAFDKSRMLSNQIRKIFLKCTIIAIFSGISLGQKTVDKIIATVNYLSLEKPEIITYSDILWQIALSPDMSIESPSKEELSAALELLIQQKLLLLEAKRLPRNLPSESEIKQEIERIAYRFPSIFEFEKRLRSVGFTSIRDENFQKIIEDRLMIEKYIDFRFRSFIVITERDEQKYYREIFVPDFRRRNPELLIPSFEKVRDQIRETLVEIKVEQEISRFIDDAKQRAEIEILSEP
ncbi:MAG: hypothetical protein D6735_00025 [Acidobacteria bacterium]|nr:MAG: hypothetical protein D6735_00025 [Acidobacteriota bacterium]